MSIYFCFLMLNFLLDQLFLLHRQVHTVHLRCQFIPSLLLFFLVIFLPSVLSFDVGFYELGSFSRRICGLESLLWLRKGLSLDWLRCRCIRRLTRLLGLHSKDFNGNLAYCLVLDWLVWAVLGGCGAVCLSCCCCISSFCYAEMAEA